MAPPRRRREPRTVPLPPTSARRGASLVFALGLGVLAVLVYLPVLDNAFVNFDDIYYIANNPQITVLNPANLRAIFTEFYFGNFQPLTLLSLALDYHWSGADPRTFHLTNLVLHAGNTILVFWFVGALLRRRDDRHTGTLRIAAVAAVLFAVHPLHVESVAWAAQRKDLLYTTFYLVSLRAYLEFAVAGRARYLVLSLLIFCCALLAKAMAVSLVGALFAVDHFLGRLDRSTRPGTLAVRRHLTEKGLFLALAIGGGALAIAAQKSSSFVAETTLHTPWQQGLYACYGLMQYLAKLIVPWRLSAYYPYPDPQALPATVWLAPLVVLVFLGWLVYCLNRHRVAGFGLLFFLVNILPVLQIVPIGNFVMADRFVYLAAMGIFVALAAGGVALARRHKAWRAGIGLVAVVYVGWLGGLTVQRCEVWQDSLTLWNDVLAQHADIPLALNNRGIARAEAGDLPGALADFDRALQIMPTYADAYCNRGLARYSVEDYGAAIADFERALVHQPTHERALRQRIDAHFYRGVQRAAAGDNQGAAADFAFVVRTAPGYPGAARNLQVIQRRLDQR